MPCRVIAPALAVALFVLGVSPLSAERSAQDQQAPVFRTSTSVVPITVTVVDKDGKPVRDLTQADFTVIEDGKTREIVNFFAQAFAPGPVPPATPGALNRAAAGRGLEPQTRRTFLFVFNNERIQYPVRAIDGVLDFIRERALPQDLIGVIGFNRATDLTTDHLRIIRMVERYRKQHEKVVLDIMEHRRKFAAPTLVRGPINATTLGMVNLKGPTEPMPQWIQDEIDAIFTGAPIGEDGKPLPLPPGQAEPMRSATEMLLGMNTIQAYADDPSNPRLTFDDVRERVYRYNNIPLSDAVTTGSLLKVYAGIEYLRYVDGEKHLIYFGRGLIGPGEPGVDVPHADTRFEAQAARRASDARVVLDLINTTGAQADVKLIQSSQNFAKLTGGFYTGVRYATEALALVDEATRFTYLIGYTPSKPNLDGKFRNVVVKVNRPGVTLRYQHGYYAVEDIPPSELKEQLTTSRLETVAGIAQEATSIGLKTNVVVLPRIGITEQIRVEITIDASNLALAQRADGTRTGELDVQVYAGDAKEKVLGDGSKRVNLSADAATYLDWKAAGIRQTLTLAVPQKPAFVKVIVYDYGSDRLGSAMVTVK